MSGSDGRLKSEIWSSRLGLLREKSVCIKRDYYYGGLVLEIEGSECFLAAMVLLNCGKAPDYNECFVVYRLTLLFLTDLGVAQTDV